MEGVNKLSFKDFMIYLVSVLILSGSFYFLFKSGIHIFNMYGPGLGIIISFLAITFSLGLSIPLMMFVLDVIEIRATIKNARSLSTKGILIEGGFISLYYYPNRKKLRWGYNAVSFLQLLVIAGKSFILFYILLGHDAFFYAQWW
jgi:hypothetical protein